MRITNDQLKVITALRQRFDQVPLELEYRIWQLTDFEDLESLRDDLRLCHTIDDVESNVTWREGRHSGRIDGMRNAVLTVLGFDDDPVVDELADMVFDTHDLEELVELLFRAVDTRFRFRLSAN
ncbi:MAG: hypothetical protein WC314_01015 [Vulcanimicrobiota bacterium]